MYVCTYRYLEHLSRDGAIDIVEQGERGWVFSTMQYRPNPQSQTLHFDEIFLTHNIHRLQRRFRRQHDPLLPHVLREHRDDAGQEYEACEASTKNSVTQLTRQVTKDPE